MKLLLKKVRTQKDFSKRKLSIESGVSRSFLDELERGSKRNISVKLLCKLACAMEVEIGDLVECNCSEYDKQNKT
ncbi:MAG: helix-turn-helix domain-containing protein [Anaeromicrobium sp.]|uniref:helix-turn-helix domain-containing protein n=1 Tax=Anaeromicrobium sp. TaxID=1929132 RepID=UPI0025D40B95|nr:helix-turn-helix transcriptional regulator [Anaeromicrobium sp.]MCT4593140.1 helix-turn-helix domain-containing protein [Anaeromicrobium sp.]